MDMELRYRASAAWGNWKKYSGVLCDRKMPVKLKGKIYRTVVTPALGKRLEVIEMRMLRWICGVTKKDKIRNEHGEDQ